MAQTPPATPRNARQSRRSASPTDQPTAIRTRDEPPAHSTRSSYSAPPILNILPTASQRVPIDCPIRGCLASTAHQHLPILQYYNARPGRAVHHHGYGSSSRGAPSRPSLVANLRVGKGQQGTARRQPEADESEAAAHSDDSSEHVALIADNKTTPGQLAGEQIATSGDTSDLQRAFIPKDPALDSWHQEGQTALEQGQDMTLQGDRPNTRASANDLQRLHSLYASSELDDDRGSHQDADGLFQKFPEQKRDPIHDDSTTSTVQAPMTPPPSSPAAAEEPPSAQETTGSPEQQEGYQSVASPAPHMELGDWLPGRGPEHNVPDHLNPQVLTYEEPARPPVDPTLAPASRIEGMMRILRDLQGSPDSSHRPDVEDEEQQYEWSTSNDLADMLGITDFATFGGISVDASSSSHIPLSFNTSPYTLCNDPECPLEGEHPTGMYLHKGEMPHTFNGEFGYSDPPPEVWYAWARIDELRGGETDFEMVNGFSKCHFWNGK